jgi:hypothetical protein
MVGELWKVYIKPCSPVKGRLQAAKLCFMLVSRLVYSLTLKIETTTLRNVGWLPPVFNDAVPEDRTLQYTPL